MEHGAATDDGVSERGDPGQRAAAEPGRHPGPRPPGRRRARRALPARRGATLDRDPRVSASAAPIRTPAGVRTSWRGFGPRTCTGCCVPTTSGGRDDRGAADALRDRVALLARGARLLGGLYGDTRPHHGRPEPNVTGIPIRDRCKAVTEGLAGVCRGGGAGPRPRLTARDWPLSRAASCRDGQRGVPSRSLPRDANGAGRTTPVRGSVQLCRQRYRIHSASIGDSRRWACWARSARFAAA